MLPQVFGLDAGPLRTARDGQGLWIFGPVMGLSAMAGPIVAGGLIDLNVFGTGWRMIFLVNVPVSIFALTAGRSSSQPSKPEQPRARLDLVGALSGRGRHVPRGLPAGPGPPTRLAPVAGLAPRRIGAGDGPVRRPSDPSQALGGRTTGRAQHLHPERLCVGAGVLAGRSSGRWGPSCSSSMCSCNPGSASRHGIRRYHGSMGSRGIRGSAVSGMTMARFGRG